MTADPGDGSVQTTDPNAPNWLDPRWERIDRGDRILADFHVYELLSSGKVSFWPNTMYPTDYDLNNIAREIFIIGQSIDRHNANRAYTDHSGVDVGAPRSPIEQWSSADLYPSILYYPDQPSPALTVWSSLREIGLNDRLNKEMPTEYNSERDIRTAVVTADGNARWAKFVFLYNYDHWLIADIQVTDQEFNGVSRPPELN